MTELVSLRGHAIIVTGAAQGIGKAIAELVIELGGAVVALAELLRRGVLP